MRGFEDYRRQIDFYLQIKLRAKPLENNTPTPAIQSNSQF